MTETKLIQIQDTKAQYARVQLRKETEGYNTMSQMIRDLFLNEDLGAEKMIKDIL